MQHNPYLVKVWDFMTKFHLPMKVRMDDPLYDKVCATRLDMMLEELVEFSRATRNRDGAEVLDALVDLQYFLSGTIRTLGYGAVFDEAFRRVHQSNMSKEPGPSIRSDSWDVIKPEGWKPANLEDLV